MSALRNRKPVIGVCGAIGAGKSAAARAFGACGGLVIASDDLQHEVLRRPEVASELGRWWGGGILDTGGAVDRRAVGRIVFADATQRERLEALTYPLIAALRADMMTRGFEDPAVRAIVLDSPLLLERRLDRLCDTLVFVDADERTRLARVAQSRGWDSGALREREQLQLAPGEKRRRCQYVVSNDGTLDDLREQCRRVFEAIVSHHSATS